MMALIPEPTCNSQNGTKTGVGDGTKVLTRTKPETEQPPMYKVLLFNDDYTPMEFVVVVLEKIFSLPRDKAISLMLAVHKNGIGVAGVFVHEIAETKARQVKEFARTHQHPLRCEIEKE